MKKQVERLKQANSLLNPHAVPHEGKMGREYKDPEDETRFAFQRDRDRIIHAQAFRRLQGKTQVFLTGAGDHYRTRLTHTMEVAQISRDIARTLSFNEDLSECIALAHDLGHPPFGHAGEHALDEWMRSHGAAFEHNLQSHRIVTVLEEHSALYPGLNLNKEVLLGLLKHTTPHDLPGASEGATQSMEAMIVNLADEIAYTGHDIDDGLNQKFFTLDDVKDIELIAHALTLLSERKTSLRGALIHLLVSDLYEHSTETNISFSADTRTSLNAVRQFLWKNLYLHPDVSTSNKEGGEVIKKLCEEYFRRPPQKVIDLQKKNNSTLEEAIKDYVSGMTDSFAMNAAKI